MSRGPTAGRAPRQHWRRRIAAEDVRALVDVLCDATALDRDGVDELLDKGAVWVRRARGRGAGKTVRVRDGAAVLAEGDVVDAYRDPKVLAAVAPDPREIEDRGAYGAWHKPAGLLSQGTRYGDHASLLRKVECARRAPAYLVHRLDREAAGVMVLAYDGPTAGRLSEQFARGTAVKDYVAIVRGDLAAGLGPEGVIDVPLDDRPARTRFRVLASSPDGSATWVAVRIDTGRTHQIRRHLDGAGFPVLGDARYGRGNKNREGLRLAAVALGIVCPVRREPVVFRVGREHVAWLGDAPCESLGFDEGGRAHA